MESIKSLNNQYFSFPMANNRIRFPHLVSTTCPAFDVTNSKQGSWKATHPGTIMTITCNSKHVLIGGDAEVTCKVDGTWSTGVNDLKCKPLSKLKC